MHCVKIGSCALCAHPRPRLRAQRHIAARTEPCGALSAVSQGRVARACYPPSCHKNRVAIQTLVASAARCVTMLLHCVAQALLRAPARRPGCVTPWRAPVPFCVTIQSCGIATRAGKWAVAHPTSPLHVFFFFIHFFFICSTHCKTTKQKTKKKISYVLVEP